MSDIEMTKYDIDWFDTEPYEGFQLKFLIFCLLQSKYLKKFPNPMPHKILLR